MIEDKIKPVEKIDYSKDILLSEQQKYILLNLDKTPEEIAIEKGKSLQSVYKILKKLEKKGLIKKLSKGKWLKIKPQDFQPETLSPLCPMEKEIQKKDVSKEFISNIKEGIEKAKNGDYSAFPKENDFSIGTSDTNLHALQIKFTILEGKIKDRDWIIKERLKNWIPRYKTMSELGGMTIKNNNNKSVTVFAKSRDIISLEEVDNLAFKIRLFIGKFFEDQGVKLDIYDCEVKNIHLETEDKNIEPFVRKKEQFTLNLNKKSEKIFEKDNIDAKAWIDPTPNPFSVGTNDKEWKRAYLSMPFGMQRLEHTVSQALIPAIEALSENINLHLGVENSIKDNLGQNNQIMSKMSLGLDEFRNAIKNINFQSITPLDSITPYIHSPADVLKPEIKEKIERLSGQDKERLSIWLFTGKH